MTELDVAREAAHAAGRLLRARPTRVVHKGVVDLVTEVDLACESAIRDVLGRHTPDLPICAEEGGGAELATTRWVVDPLDGTTNFVHGFPVYAVSVALEVDGVGSVGVVYDPVRDRTYGAARGRGSTCNGAPMRVSAVDEIGQALVATGFPYDRQDRAAFYLRRVEAVLRRAQCVRRAGAASLDLAWVAEGVLDAFWEFSLRPWDVAAGRLLVEEAGGQVTGHLGEALTGDRLHPLATNGALHGPMREILAAVDALETAR